MARDPRFAAKMLRWHRWLALALAPLLLGQALTGLVLVLGDPVARMTDPAVGAAGPAAPPARLIAAAQGALPGAVVYRLDYPGRADAPVQARLVRADGAERFAALDPHSGAVLRSGGFAAFPLRLAEQWHYRLLLGVAGIGVVMLGGAGLVLIGGSGLWQWWPGRGKIRASLKINPRLPARIRLRHWHRSIGVVVAVVLLNSAVTGLVIAWPGFSLPTIGAPAVPPPPTGTTQAQVDAAWADGAARMAPAALHDLRVGSHGRVTLHYAAPGGNVHALDRLVVTPDAPLVLTRAATAPPAWMQVMPFHAGDIAGWPGRILVGAGALALIFLTLSGPLMWWRARRKPLTQKA
ncbi:hypothetical protein GTZ99_07675 [Novosphingobium sp. FSY-8]|uniref:Iron-regulated membrane protein n=1 Tax=Novosphingobium ovatum TaxID=1908523 RepID=A0ABW9XD16_9SPHN|nr:PepSY-associated TM helix domain-containing protein [Novosphingobium ovatum]NBC36431.1 hypothetical protein [Novosphingobium ovatum]